MANSSTVIPVLTLGVGGLFIATAIGGKNVGYNPLTIVKSVLTGGGTSLVFGAASSTDVNDSGDISGNTTTPVPKSITDPSGQAGLAQDPGAAGGKQNLNNNGSDPD